MRVTRQVRAAVRWSVLIPLAVLGAVARSVRFHAWLRLLNQRRFAFSLLRASVAPGTRPRVLAIVTHVVPDDCAREADLAQKHLDRVRRTFDGLLQSCAHCDLHLVLLTVPGRSLDDRLPDYLRNRVEVIVREETDPRFVQYRAQDIAAERRGRYDWYLAMDDDIVIEDASLLAKYALFNATVGSPRYLLMPNIFELHEGRKTYVNLYEFNEHRPIDWNGMARVELGGVVFGECWNPHSAFYCLDARQLDWWLDSPRQAYGKVVFEGPAESAMSGCLLERFMILRPAPENLWFVEAKHWDTKYSTVVAHAQAAVGADGDFTTPSGRKSGDGPQAPQRRE